MIVPSGVLASLGVLIAGVVGALVAAMLRRPVDKAQVKLNEAQTIGSQLATVIEISTELRRQNTQTSQENADLRVLVTQLRAKILDFGNQLTASGLLATEQTKEIEELKEQVATLTVEVKRLGDLNADLRVQLARPVDPSVRSIGEAGDAAAGTRDAARSAEAASRQE